MSSVLIFAGQGAEEPGMGVARAAKRAVARRWLEEASRVTGVDVPRALERGGQALTRTDVLQPALVAVGLASAELATASRVAGHSLGELTAACWAASLPPRVALELAALRGRLMHEAAQANPGGMLVIRGVGEAQLEAILDDGRAHGELRVAALNTADEIIVSGDEPSLAWLERALAGRCTRLRVAGAWHSERMRPAVEPLREAARKALAGRALRAPFMSCARVSEIAIDAIPDALAEGLVRPVRFAAAVRQLDSEGVDRAVLSEPSRTARSLLRRAGARRWTFEAL